MAKKNIIRIAGVITDTPKMTLDAAEFDKKTFETKIAAERRSGAEDTLILVLSGGSVGTKKALDKIKKGAAVMVTGEVRTVNVKEIKNNAPTVKIFIEASKVEPIEKIETRINEVKLKGRICKDPRIRQTPKGIHVADIMVAVSGKKGANFIPCICWQNVADAAEKIEKGMYVEIEGRFQSREYKKQIEGSVPYLMTAYEVSITQLGVDFGDHTEEQQEDQTEAEPEAQNEE